MIYRSLRLTLLVGFVFLLGCQKSDFLYYLNDKPATYAETYTIKELVGLNKVDILWVIDNSGSMGPFQQAVINNTNDFIDELSKDSRLKWRIGLISTDDVENPYTGFDFSNMVESSNPSSVNMFKSAVAKLGTYGSGFEEAFDPILKTLQNYPKFRRSDAYFSLIVVSDAMEQSGYGATEFLDRLGQITDIKKMGFYGVLGPNEWCANGEGWKYTGSSYEELAKSVPSSTFPVCSSKFGEELVKIAKSIVSMASNPKLFLDAWPRPSTIQVFHKGVGLPGGPKEKGGYWYYNPQINAIVFYNLDFAPTDTEQVTVSFVEDNGNPY